MAQRGQGPGTVVESLRRGPLHRDLSEAPRGCIDPVCFLSGHPEVTDLQDVLLRHQTVPSSQVPGKEWAHLPGPGSLATAAEPSSSLPPGPPGPRQERQLCPWSCTGGTRAAAPPEPGPLGAAAPAAHLWMQHLLSRYSMPAAASPTICSRVFIRRRAPSVRRKVRKSPPGGGRGKPH